MGQAPGNELRGRIRVVVLGLFCAANVNEQMKAAAKKARFMADSLGDSKPAYTNKIHRFKFARNRGNRRLKIVRERGAQPAVLPFDYGV